MYFQDDCDQIVWDNVNQTTYWLPKTNSSAHITIDLGCAQVVDNINLKNTHNAYHNDRGTKGFTILISNTTEGPWKDVLTETLSNVIGQV